MTYPESIKAERKGWEEKTTTRKSQDVNGGKKYAGANCEEA
jgi:hypothetical protein